MNEKEIKELLKPETELEKRIISDLEFIEGANYGKPRNSRYRYLFSFRRA